MGVEVVALLKLKPVDAGAAGAGVVVDCPPKLNVDVEELGAPNTPVLLAVDVVLAPNTEPAVLAPNDGVAEFEVAPKAGVEPEPNVEVELDDPNTLPDDEVPGAAPKVVAVAAAPNAGAVAELAPKAGAGVADDAAPKAGVAEDAAPKAGVVEAAPPKLKPVLGVVVVAPKEGVVELAALADLPKLKPEDELEAVDVAPKAGVPPAVELDPNENPVDDAAGAAGVEEEPKLNPVEGAAVGAAVELGAPNKFEDPAELVLVAVAAPPKLKPVLGAELVVVDVADPKLNPLLGPDVDWAAEFAVAVLLGVLVGFNEPKLKPLLAEDAAGSEAPKVD